MPFVPFGQLALGGVAPAWMTNANPPPVPVRASTRGWVPAINPYATGVAMAPFIGSEVAFRGDTRSPATIEQAGGLVAHQPNAGWQGQDPDVHQAGPGATVYVSCSRDLGIAKQFAGQNGYVYLVRINAGVDYNAYRGGNALQAEVMAIKAVATGDILAARSNATGQVYVNTNFQQAGMTQQQWNAALQALRG